MRLKICFGVESQWNARPPGQILKRFFCVRNTIKIFFAEKRHSASTKFIPSTVSTLCFFFRRQTLNVSLNQSRTFKLKKIFIISLRDAFFHDLITNASRAYFFLYFMYNIFIYTKYNVIAALAVRLSACATLREV